MIRPARLPTSDLLRQLLQGADPHNVSLGWLIGRLGECSFGVVLLLLGLLAMLPGLSNVSGLLLLVPAFQMLIARHGPVFPGVLARRRIDTPKLAKVLGRAVPMLAWLERFIRPRWRTPFQATKRVVGLLVLLLDGLLHAPVPLSNIPPAFVIVLIAIAYLEEDGALLCLALLLSLVMLGAGSVLIWESLSAMGWLPSML